MEKALTKLGSFTIPRKAKQELSAIGGDISRISSTVEEKAKWVFEKLKDSLSSGFGSGSNPSTLFDLQSTTNTVVRDADAHGGQTEMGPMFVDAIMQKLLGG